MKKLFTLAAALLLFVGVSSAQTYFNIGYGQGTTVTTNGDHDPSNNLSNIVYAGISHNFRFGDFVGFELGANFAYDFSNTKYETLDNAGFKTQYMGVTVPALFNYKLALSRDLCFKIFLGPTFNYGLKYGSTFYADDQETTFDYYDGEQPYNRFAVSASAAFAMEVAEAFRVKIGYDYGITDVNSTDYIKQKENVLNFSVAYMF